MGNGHSVLISADNIINGERQKDYGNPGPLFAAWSAAFNAYLGCRSGEIEPQDMAVAMVLLKLLRFKNSGYTHEDSLLDAAGYIGLMEKLREWQKCGVCGQ